MELNDRERSALNLIKSDPKHLTVAGHQLVNGSVAALLKAGLVKYDRNKHTGYAPTLAGLHVL
jgi:hypothetical protein